MEEFFLIFQTLDRIHQIEAMIGGFKILNDKIFGKQRHTLMEQKQKQTYIKIPLQAFSHYPN
jgi:hypothetical protein